MREKAHLIGFNCSHEAFMMMGIILYTQKTAPVRQCLMCSFRSRIRQSTQCNEFNTNPYKFTMSERLAWLCLYEIEIHNSVYSWRCYYLDAQIVIFYTAVSHRVS